MKFNPEDNELGGPRCRNCHRGSSGCGSCHNNDPDADGVATKDEDDASDNNRTAVTFLFAAMFNMVDEFYDFQDDGNLNGSVDNFPYPNEAFAPATFYKLTTTADGQTNGISQELVGNNFIDDPELGKPQILKSSRMVSWSDDWRSEADPANITSTCSDDGLSWPHRTLGWKLLKDDLFGIDVAGYDDGTSKVVAVGETRTFNWDQANKTFGNVLGTSLQNKYTAHDLDSVCLDCHNPTIWNASGARTPTIGDDDGGEDSMANDSDNKDDELLIRGLP